MNLSEKQFKLAIVLCFVLFCRNYMDKRELRTKENYENNSSEIKNQSSEVDVCLVTGWRL